MARIRLEQGDFGFTFLIVNEETQKDILVQTDWDYPGVASSFGYSPCKDCKEECKGATDGTVNCKLRTASDMISEASEFLTDNVGESADDPGYFE